MPYIVLSCREDLSMADQLPFLSRASTWDAFFSESHVDEFRRSLYLEAFGQAYPAEDTTDGYVTRSELRTMADALHLGPSQTIADLGCGRGGPGQWVVRAVGGSLVGIDFSEVALDHARARALHAGVESMVSYQLGRFDATGLGDSSFDGAISIDVIWAIPDKLAGFAETARILKPGGRFVFIDWERDLSPPGYPPPIKDHRPLLKVAGFDVELHQFDPQADAMRRVFYERMLAREAELIRVLDEKTARSNLREARAWLGMLDGVDYMHHSRRVLVAASKGTPC
jgi:ubiquinone/menaquinone biosynthesis C-methylase UbiE